MSRTQIATSLINTAGPTAIVPSGTVLDYAGPTAPSGWTECDGSAISRTTFSALFTAIGTTWGVGDGSTTFNVPDLRRRTCVGRGGASTGTLGNTIGSTGGEENHVLSVAELATHNHGVTDPGHTHTVTDPGHNHTQNAHSHTDSGHNHSQNAHNHSQGVAAGGPNANSTSGGSGSGNTIGPSSTSSVTASNNSSTANITSTTATNNSTTTGVTNASNTTGISTNNNGSNTGHNTIQPSAVMIKIIKQ